MSPSTTTFHPEIGSPISASLAITGAARWTSPAVFSIIIHSALIGGYLAWQGAGEALPRASKVFIVELLAVPEQLQRMSGTPEILDTTPESSAARYRASSPSLPLVSSVDQISELPSQVKNDYQPKFSQNPVVNLNSDVSSGQDSSEPVSKSPMQPDRLSKPVKDTLPETVSKPRVFKPRIAKNSTSEQSKVSAALLELQPDKFLRYAPPPKFKRLRHPTTKLKDQALANKSPNRAKRPAKRLNSVQKVIPIQTKKVSNSVSGVASSGEATAKVVPPRYAAPGRGNPLPVYPRAARRANLEGRLILRVEVTMFGRADNVKILKGSGHTVLDRAAQRAVKRWRFEPGRRAGVPVRAGVDIPVVFRLKR